MKRAAWAPLERQRGGPAPPTGLGRFPHLKKKSKSALPVDCKSALPRLSAAFSLNLALFWDRRDVKSFWYWCLRCKDKLNVKIKTHIMFTFAGGPSARICVYSVGLPCNLKQTCSLWHCVKSGQTSYCKEICALKYIKAISLYNNNNLVLLLFWEII